MNHEERKITLIENIKFAKAENNQVAKDPF